ncbi:uncharacterized protein Z519_06198 [Cladophialophora bantiana CBS 173.52]|uniref:Uncharacterized protein n=1 Tax=Cladophialophora bantiana (strain ATCC 10958 / CBS 173.52 / CDC B-1940 / NIH 8579) TaxID=1442370 RepID=A0A0D2HK03_CLAB1|nr:uncharacterized protein Z519_06198 [Cladophialophora bantiana CBS 173.52]KIW93593.1 hypothetical protein Z519_06198 [Cladophialophora bantiana CBS 173.52]
MELDGGYFDSSSWASAFPTDQQSGSQRAPHDIHATVGPTDALLAPSAQMGDVFQRVSVYNNVGLDVNLLPDSMNRIVRPDVDSSRFNLPAQTRFHGLGSPSSFQVAGTTHAAFWARQTEPSAIDLGCNSEGFGREPLSSDASRLLSTWTNGNHMHVLHSTYLAVSRETSFSQQGYFYPTGIDYRTHTNRLQLQAAQTQPVDCFLSAGNLSQQPVRMAPRTNTASQQAQAQRISRFRSVTADVPLTACTDLTPNIIQPTSLGNNGIGLEMDATWNIAVKDSHSCHNLIMSQTGAPPRRSPRRAGYQEMPECCKADLKTRIPTIKYLFIDLGCSMKQTEMIFHLLFDLRVT